MRKALLGCAAIAALLMLAVPAQATLVLSYGLVGGSGDVDNVIYNACGLGGATGTTVQGCLNSDHTTLVNFTGHETLAISGGGQAVINAGDGAFDYVKIALADPTRGFSKLQFNLDAVANGTATFRAVDQFGGIFDFGPLNLDGTGQNFFTLYSLDNQVAKSFELLSTVGLQAITDLEHVRLGPATIEPPPPPPPPPPPGVPEPGTLGLMGAGLIGLGRLIIRRRM